MPLYQKFVNNQIRMKKTILFIFALMTATAVQAQGIDFFKGTWSEVLQQSQKEGKPIFLDVYTSWCAPCKKLAKTTFTDQKVGAFFNANFINYQIDAEKGEGIDLAKQYGVGSYPTCIFINPDGKRVHQFLGFKTPVQILREGEQAKTNSKLLPELEVMDADYEKGNREKEFLLTYVQKREDFGTHGGRPLLELIQSMDDTELTAEENTSLLRSLDIYDAPTMDRLVRLDAELMAKDRKENIRFNQSVMSALSTLVDQATDKKDHETFQHLMDIKDQMDLIEQSNRDNATIASMGGGIAYMSRPLMEITYYRKNGPDSEFERVYRAYIKECMHKEPVDSLIELTNQEARYYNQMMQNDELSEEEKKDWSQSYGLMRLFSRVNGQLLAGSLFTGALHLWDIRPEHTQADIDEYTRWIWFFYAKYRNADLALPLVEKLVEFGKVDDARRMLTDLSAYLKLQDDPDEQLPVVQEAYEKLSAS